MHAQDPPRGLGKRLVAHRGWTARYPENTLAAVRGALEAGAAAVEVDVQLSKDGVPHPFHDRSLERLCGVSGSLGQRTRAELERVLPVPEPLACRAALISFDPEVLRLARKQPRWPIGPVSRCPLDGLRVTSFAPSSC